MSYVEDGFVVWPLLPNWKNGVRESLTCKTEVIGGGPSLTGVRQKRARRTSPRRAFEFTVHPHGAGRRLMDNIENDRGAREYMLPIWHDRQSLSATLASGSTEIPCDTVNRDFGQYAVLRSGDLNQFNFEVVEITSIAADEITLGAATVSTWPKGTRLYPLRRGRLLVSPSTTLLTDDVGTKLVSFEISEPCDWAAHTFADEYLGYPVWDVKPDWSSTRPQSFDRINTIVDNDTSIPVVFDFPDTSFRMTSIKWTARNRTDHALQRSVFYALRGKQHSIWVPSYLQDLKLASTLGSGSTAMTVQWCGYTVFGKHQESRRDLRIELYDGSVYYRRVTAEAEAGANEVLTINASLGVEVVPSQVKRISFMVLSELATDSVMFDHLTDAAGVTVASFAFEGVVAPP
jgi:hypothetical protein